MADPKTTAGKLTEIVYDLVLLLEGNADHLDLSVSELHRILEELRDLDD